jgi:hypothetical protein
MGFYVFATRTKLYLQDPGASTWTRARSSAREFGSRSAAMRVLRAHRRRHGLALQVVGPAPAIRARPGRTPEQLRAVDLARRFGALVRQGAYWVPAGMPGPHLAPVTVSSLVKHGDLVVAEERVGDYGRRRWLRIEAARSVAA